MAVVLRIMDWSNIMCPHLVGLFTSSNSQLFNSSVGFLEDSNTTMVDPGLDVLNLSCPKSSLNISLQVRTMKW